MSFYVLAPGKDGRRPARKERRKMFSSAKKIIMVGRSLFSKRPVELLFMLKTNKTFINPKNTITLDLPQFIPRAVRLSRIKAFLAPQARTCARLQTNKLAGTNIKTR